MAILLALCRVEGLLPDAGNVGTTAIDKRPVDKALKVRPYGLHGDVQADRKHHGGLNKALYAYADEDAQEWASNLGREILPGLFGENLRTAGLDVSGAVIGERWQIGEKVVLEVTCPRNPCATFQRRMREPHWVRRFTEAGKPGAYLRVVKSGEISAGDEITVVSRPSHGVTISHWFSNARAADAAALVASESAGEFVLAPEMRESLSKVASASRQPAAVG
jgi:MOSC domain-containing protein YiiM